MAYVDLCKAIGEDTPDGLKMWLGAFFYTALAVAWPWAWIIALPFDIWFVVWVVKGFVRWWGKGERTPEPPPDCKDTTCVKCRRKREAEWMATLDPKDINGTLDDYVDPRP